MARMLRTVFDTTNLETADGGPTARGRGPARNTPGHLQLCRGSGMRELVLQVCGNDQGSLRPQPSGTKRAKTPWKIRDAKDRGHTYYDQSHSTKFCAARRSTKNRQCALSEPDLCHAGGAAERGNVDSSAAAPCSCFTCEPLLAW